MKKQLISMLLVVVMVLGLMPVGAVAAAPGDTVYVTLSNKGAIATTADGAQVAQLAVTLPSGSHTVDQVLLALHEQFFADGTDGYSQSDGVITKLWGVSGGNYGFFRNHALGNLVTDTVEAGDTLDVIIYSKTGKATESYAFFSNSTMTATTGENVTVELKTLADVEFGTTQPVNAAVLSANGTATVLKTDTQGQAVLNFAKAGTYVITAKGNALRSAASCTIIVTGDDKVNAKIKETNIYRAIDSDKHLATISPSFSENTEKYDLYIPEKWQKLGYCYQDVAVENGDGYFWSITYLVPSGKKYVETTKTYALNDAGATAYYLAGEETRTLRLLDSGCNTVKEYFFTTHYLPVIDMTITSDVESDLPKVTSIWQEDGFTQYDCYVTEDATSITLKPSPHKNDTENKRFVTINGQKIECVVNGTVSSYDSVTIPLSELKFEAGKATIDIVVSCSAQQYVDNRYTLNVIREIKEDTPFFLQQPKGNKEYLSAQGDKNYEPPAGSVIDFGAYTEPLNAMASASGEVTYQWYRNTIDSNENGVLIDGATESSYSPTWDASSIIETTAIYYYCVATCGTKSTASQTAKILVHPTPTLTWEWAQEIPTLPDVEDIDFDGHTNGYFWYTGDTASSIKVNAKLKDADPSVNDRLYTVLMTYQWDVPGQNRYTTLGTGTSATVTPKTTTVWSGEAICTISVRFRYASAAQFSMSYVTDPVYIHVAGSVTIEPLEDPDAAIAEAWPKGDGSQETPWLLESKEDVEELRKFVNLYNMTFEGKYFQIANDIDLEKWEEPIGALRPGYLETENGVNIYPFSGNLDGGGHKLSFAEGSKPLFGYVREATVSNFDIYAPYMDGYGLVENYTVDYGSDGQYGVGEGGSYARGCPDTIEITNVNILSGSIIRQSGFLGGWASGGNTVKIRNCTVEEGVKIGCLADGTSAGNIKVGSFGGDFNGTIVNSTSAAEVYGTDYVGGLVGAKGQSMGPYAVYNSSFTGKVVATGDMVGGIAGGGYTSESAPNSPCASIVNCYVAADVTGKSNVGGVFGGEKAVQQCWSNGIGTIRNNHFYGTVKGQSNVGGIIGYMHSLNKYNIIENNFYLDSCGAAQGIGLVNEEYIDLTSRNYARDDDPLGADAEKLTKAMSAEAFADETVLNLLNGQANSYRNWNQGTKYPITENNYITSLIITEPEKKVYEFGEELDLTGLTITAVWGDGKRTPLAVEDVNITGFFPNRAGLQTVTVSYGAGKAEFQVTVRTDPNTAYRPVTIDLTVSMGEDFYVTSDGTELVNQTLTVPYFDLALYGLEGYYYNPDCYGETQIPGTAETAEGVVTLMHAFIYATERFQMGMSAEEAGRGKDVDGLNELISWTQGVGSTYMRMWELGTNLNYYVNYTYPLAKQSWGATSDQIALTDGDVITVHGITSTATGTSFTYFELDGQKDAGSIVECREGLKLYNSQISDNYQTAYALLDNEAVYYNVEGEWKLLGYTDQGAVDTTALEPGVYQLRTKGHLDTATNLEIAPAWFVLTVEDCVEHRYQVDDSRCEPATCSREGKQVSVCACGAELVETIAKTAHSYASQVVEATCTANGYTSYTCTECGDNYVNALTPALGHSYEALTTEPTHNKMGFTTHTCATCGSSYVDSFTDALEHEFTSEITREATCEAEGELTFICECGESYTQSIPRAAHTYEEVVTPAGCKTFGYVEQVCTLCGSSSIIRILQPQCPSEAFADVEANAWYHEAVDYAIANGLMNGIDAKTFAPNGTTTRSMMATLLYRMAGEPDVTGLENPFTDVPANAWYNKAVVWAYSKGIVTGATATTFNPDGELTREQLAVMLWRYADKPEADETVLNGFADVKNVGEYAKTAMAWAVETGLVNGTGNQKLDPTGSASRAQIATILMRYTQN